MKRTLTAIVMGGGLLIGTSMGTMAQKATPDAITGVPDPSECTVEPRSLESFQAALATPAATAPAALPETPELPDGEPADAETEAAVLATLREGVACINAGQFDQLLAIYSDDAIRNLLGGVDADPAALFNDLSTPEPAAEDERTEIIEVQGVVVLPDGRVAALILGDDHADADPASPTLFVFVEQDGRWLIDAFIETPDDATPVP